jgi:hypothetical protein
MTQRSRQVCLMTSSPLFDTWMTLLFCAYSSCRVLQFTSLILRGLLQNDYRKTSFQIRLMLVSRVPELGQFLLQIIFTLVKMARYVSSPVYN